MLFIFIFWISYYFLSDREFFWYLFYPIKLFVTFLHEFWHVFFALVTWWTMWEVKINFDGSGLATTSWWIRALVILWWYIGSALFWALILYYTSVKRKYAEYMIYFLIFLMLYTGIVLFSNIYTSVILFWLVGLLFFLVRKTKLSKYVMQFIWIASLIHILKDFRVWPSSDLAHFTEIFIFIPQIIWMYIWFWIVIFIVVFTLRKIYKS